LFYVSTWLDHSAQTFGPTLFWPFCEHAWGWELHLNQILSKVDCFHNVSRPYPVSWRPEQNKRLTSPSKREFFQ
jgi:hypothetical protein